MKPPDAAKSRALSILVIAACLALGTITVIRRAGDIWYYFAAIFYGIALINITAEILLARRVSRQRRRIEQMQKEQQTPEDKDRGGPPDSCGE